jgi:hypothetical protein
MEEHELQKLVTAIGATDAEAVQRFFGEGCSLCQITEAADQVELDWPGWAKAAAVLQRWLEANQRNAEANRKIGYLSCTVEGFKNVPANMRPALAPAVARMLEQFGFAE